MAGWYYFRGDDQIGPIEGSALKELAVSGQISPQTLVWREGMEDWVPAARVTGLFTEPSALPSPPPHPPRTASPAQQPMAGGAMRCHEVTYEIHGHDLQVVEVELDNGETVIAEAGAMNYMEDGIQYETKMGDGSKPDPGIFGKLFDGAKRMFTGESLFLTHFTNHAPQAKRVAFAAPYPGKIMALDLSEYGQEVLCQKDSFLCAALGTEVSIAFTRRLGTGFFGGEGFILQRMRGDGMAFIHAGGTVVRKDLHGETLRVDTGCLVAFTPSVDYNIEMAGGLKSMLFGGEGLFLATLRGHGTVWLQTLPFARLAGRIARQASIGSSKQGEGSILGGLGDLFGDR